jgi:hypothetical protein
MVTRTGYTLFGGASTPTWGGASGNGLLGATFDPLLANVSAGVTTAGVLLTAKAFMEQSGPVTSIEYLVAAGGATLTAGQCGLGVYSAAGALLGQTGDLSTAWTSTGYRSSALTVPTASLPAGSYVYVAMLWNGTTSPQLRGVSATAAVVNISQTSQFRFGSGGSGLTALPATLPALTASTQAVFFGLK